MLHISYDVWCEDCPVLLAYSTSIVGIQFILFPIKIMLSYSVRQLLYVPAIPLCLIRV